MSLSGKSRGGSKKGKGPSRRTSATPPASPHVSRKGGSAKRPKTKRSKKSEKPRERASIGTPPALEDLRIGISALDEQIVELLNKRAKLAVQVGKVKRKHNVPIYTPHREQEVLSRVLKQNAGPLPDRTIEGVYKEIMSGSFALERPLRIGYLGPAGSYSHLAAVRQFGSSVDYENLHEIRGVFTEVIRGHVDYGLVPIENSTGGGIVETLDAFIENKGQINIYAEVQIEIHHALLANCKPSNVRRIHSKPEVFTQCRTWLATQYPQAELVPAPSSSRAAQIAAEEYKQAEAIGAEGRTAAIGSVLAGQIYGLRTLFEKIEDNPNNITRFFVISRQKTQRSGDDKTSMMFTTLNKPGALVDVLAVLRDAGINLTHIDKRPAGRSNWTYAFFIDAQGHRDDKAMTQAIAEAEKHCKELVVLGSYPRAARIL
ncbi:MAG: prephenate dehydratase [Phycisphaeraceae bacterium]|nr:prephenate dehydratase [Phycisphaeraceae bacterium]MBX3365750.1 prephenate dehydratase [Phycisphaeraceae bacterium]